MAFLTARGRGSDVTRWRSAGRAVRGADAPVTWRAHVGKALVFGLGGVVVVAATTDLGGLDDLTSWWTAPIAFEKFAVWALLWELIGLGTGCTRLDLRSRPPVGLRYFLRPGTVRLPPWPEKVAFTGGTRRGVVDAVLYAAVLALGVALLGSGGGSAGALPHVRVWVLLACLAALGLRDRTAFLAARPELYAPMLLVFTFPAHQVAFSLKLCLVVLWWGAAASAVNRHAAYALAASLAAAPWNHGPQHATRAARLWRAHPDDLRPSRAVVTATHLGTALRFVAPLVLLVSRGGWPGVVAVAVLLALEVLDAAVLRPGVPLESHVFVGYATVVLFQHYAGVGAPPVQWWPLTLALLLVLAVPLILGNVSPRRISALTSWRRDPGNRAASVWLLRDDGAEQQLHRTVVPGASVPAAMPAHHPYSVGARALDGLLPRAVDSRARYVARDGETVAAAVLGWTFGDGHLHDARLLAAVQERCRFVPGRLRVITLESQPIRRRTRQYAIHDAAAGLLEAGTVRVADLARLAAAPSHERATVPVEITFQVLPPARPRVVPLPPDPAESRRPRPRPRPQTVGADRP